MSAIRILLCLAAICVSIADVESTAIHRTDVEYLLEKEPQYWREVSREELHTTMSELYPAGHAKNVILFLGDGMGIPTVTAGRILGGQMLGRKGEETKLSFDKFPFTGLSRTYNVDTQVTDSAASGTAYLTGVKTNQGMLGLNAHALRSQCSTAQGREVHSILDWFLDAGRSAGIVTTTRVTHATPAATYAHTPERDWEADTDVPEADRGQCKDIAAQLVEDNPGISVILGGGRENFYQKGEQDPDSTHKPSGKRSDKNLIELWKDMKRNENLNHSFVYDKQGLDNVNLQETDSLLGLFSPDHMDYEYERNRTKQPSLAHMTESAIQILQKNNQGFFLLVEGGRIDHGHHESKASAALHDVVSFSEAVDRASRLTSQEDTLIVVTADHSHTMMIAGYSNRGNPILGKSTTPERATDHMPYTTILYGNGGGFDHRANITDIDTEANGYRQQSALPMESETHGGEDVAIYARGPHSMLFTGVHEQCYIPFAMSYIACVGEHADQYKNCAKHHDLVPRRTQVQFRSHQPNNGATSSIKYLHILLATMFTSFIMSL